VREEEGFMGKRERIHSPSWKQKIDIYYFKMKKN
jgi:hypothetical protein